MGKINPSGDKYGLGGSKDTDLDGIDSNTYDVFTDDDKLADARRDFSTYDWFASYTVKYKNGGQVGTMPAYKLKFDKPASGKLYYYLNGNVYEVGYEDDGEKNGKKRVKATMTIGDPPVGMG